MLSVSDINLFIVQSVLIVILFSIVLWLFGLIKITKLERRFCKFSIAIIEDKEISLFDKLIKSFNHSRKNISKYLYKT